ncbi:TM2 domain-containing protein [Actinoplanes palleronii]|uniref:TM2 domain-containing protein n=1 Tax=Actinoplanes palleronii TaxID=113570 RepID=UPI001EF2588C|nr:TM2 domain-containing protein [Actinoplanes palleronii]
MTTPQDQVGLPAPLPAPPVLLPEWERLRLLRAESEFDAIKKDPRHAYAIWAVAGIFGGHRFYLGDTARSIAMLFTLGGLGVWTVLDVFFLARRVRAVNQERRATVMARYRILDAT